MQFLFRPHGEVDQNTWRRKRENLTRRLFLCPGAATGLRCQVASSISSRAGSKGTRMSKPDDRETGHALPGPTIPWNPYASPETQPGPQLGESPLQPGAAPQSLAVSYDLAALTHAELRRLALWAMFPRSRNPWRGFLLFQLGLIIWLATVGFLVGMLAEPNLSAEAMAGIFGAFGLFFPLRLVRHKRLVESLLRRQGRITVEISPQGLVRHTRHRWTWVAWPGVARMVATPREFLFYFSEAELFWMPRRVFTSAEDDRRFFDAAAQWFNASRTSPSQQGVY